MQYFLECIYITIFLFFLKSFTSTLSRLEPAFTKFDLVCLPFLPRVAISELNSWKQGRKKKQPSMKIATADLVTHFELKNLKHFSLYVIRSYK